MPGWLFFETRTEIEVYAQVRFLSNKKHVMKIALAVIADSKKAQGLSIQEKWSRVP